MTHAARQCNRHRARFALAPCAVAALILASTNAAAQDAKLERVEITGSSIKRLESEAALPVQVLKRDDIDKSGVTTAAELLKNLSASNANLGDGASITDNVGGQRGFNGANLRGIGVSSTLILLNGRRLANFASPGDRTGVDLNAIPAGAIERVEVLKDGASAIYGTDAIGGVINFITRKDYQGVNLAGYVASTGEGGAGKRTGTLAAGYGDVASDRFNLFGVLDVQQLDSLRSSERRFLRERPLTQTVPYYLSSRPFPANIRLSGNGATRAGQLAAINAAGYRFNGAPYTDRNLNLAAPGCSPPASVYAPEFLAQGCGYDYMADTEIYPDSRKISFIGRGVFQLTSDTQVFAELLKSRAETTYVLSPNPTTVGGVTFAALNPYLPRPITNTSPFEVRVRASEAGNRTNEVTSDSDRFVVGVTGSAFADWDYTVAANYAANDVADKYVNGYFLFNEYAAAVRAGQVNVVGPSTPAGRALIDSLRINDVARKSKGTTTAIDGKLTGSVGQLAGGEIGVAVGAEVRRETQKFTPSALLLSNNIAGDRDGSGTSPPIVATDNSRNIFSAFGEVVAPWTKALETQLALRYDHYEQIGNTVNPKVGVRWQPSRTLLLRGSAGTGFRAPSFSELYRPTSFGTSPAFLYDSVYDSFEQYPTVKQANPDLKPEKSRQFSLGIVIEPTEAVSVSLDYWNIKKKDVISDLYEKTILENPDRYAAYITRDPLDDFPTILLKKENQGRLETSGIDVELNLRGPATELGRFSAGLSGTYVLEYKRQFGPQEPFVSNVGRFLNDQVIQRWRHRLSADWERGPVGVALGSSFYSSYTDDSYLPDTAPRKVSSYTLWDLSASWRPTKALKLRGGVINLFDKQPPYSNQSYYFLATYDPTYTDPRGRTFFLSASYDFK